MQEVTNKEKGTCIWFVNAYGYIGFGLYTNNAYENQIYVHYKNINRKGLRDKGKRNSQSSRCSYWKKWGNFLQGKRKKKTSYGIS